MGGVHTHAEGLGRVFYMILIGRRRRWLKHKRSMLDVGAGYLSNSDLYPAYKPVMTYFVVEI